MSWLVTLNKPTPVEEFDQALDAAVEQASVPQQNPAGVEAAGVAVAAAKQIVASGVVGGAGAKVTAMLSGHANPGHAPQPGWSNDCVSINIQQVEEAGKPFS